MRDGSGRPAHPALMPVDRQSETLGAGWLLRRAARQKRLARLSLSRFLAENRRPLFGNPASSPKEGKQPLPVLAKPLGAVFRLIEGRVVDVPGALLGRERLGGNDRPPADGAPGRRIALLGEGRAGQEGEGGREADRRQGFGHWSFLFHKTPSIAHRAPINGNTRGPPNIRAFATAIRPGQLTDCGCGDDGHSRHAGEASPPRLARASCFRWRGSTNAGRASATGW